MLSIQLYKGRIRVQLSLGDMEPAVLSIAKSKRLNDGHWHTVEIYHNASVTFISLLHGLVQTVKPE